MRSFRSVPALLLMALLGACILIGIQQVQLHDLKQQLLDGSVTPNAGIPPVESAAIDESPAPVRDSRRTYSSSGPPDQADDLLKEELGAAAKELADLKRPLRQPMASSTVHARLKNDEVLVTGGYEVGDGLRQFTFIQPEPTTLEDGREAIFVKSRVIELDEEAILTSGLSSLATNARNTLQHAEAWDGDDFEDTLRRIHAERGIDAVMSPTVLTLPGHSFKIEMGNARESVPGYSIDGQLVPVDDGGGFDVQTRIERADPRSHAAP